MRVEISFTVGFQEEPNHHTDSRFSKVFEVDWPGRPMVGETIELDIGHPISEESFEVAGFYWMTERPTWIYLKRIVIPEDWEGWDGDLPGYGKYCKERHGWEVTGLAGRAPKPKESS